MKAIFVEQELSSLQRAKSQGRSHNEMNSLWRAVGDQCSTLPSETIFWTWFVFQKWRLCLLGTTTREDNSVPVVFILLHALPSPCVTLSKCVRCIARLSFVTSNMGATESQHQPYDSPPTTINKYLRILCGLTDKDRPCGGLRENGFCGLTL